MWTPIDLSLSTVTVKAGDAVSLYSGGVLSATMAQSRQSSVTASSLGGLYGTFDAGTGVTLVATAPIASSTTVTAGTFSAGVVDLFSTSSLEGNYTVNGSLVGTGLKDVKGTYNVTTGGATLFAGYTADATVVADGNVVVNAGKTIQNSLTSNTGSVTAGI